MRTGTSTALLLRRVHQDEGVHLRVIRRVMEGVELDQGSVDGEEAGGRVRHAVPGGHVDEEAEEPDAEYPRDAHSIFRLPEEPGADDRRRPPRQDRLQHLGMSSTSCCPSPSIRTTAS